MRVGSTTNGHLFVLPTESFEDSSAVPSKNGQRMTPGLQTIMQRRRRIHIISWQINSSPIFLDLLTLVLNLRQASTFLVFFLDRLGQSMSTYVLQLSVFHSFER